MAEILQGDVIEVLRGYADESFTCVLSDPPYGLGKQPDMTEVLTHWLAGEKHGGSPRKGRKNCAANILNRALVDDANDTDAIIAEKCVAFHVSIPGFAMRGRNIQLDDEFACREKEIDHESSGGPLKDVLVDESYSQIGKALSDGQFMLRKREGSPGCVGVCACFTQIGPSLYSIDVGLGDSALADSKSAPNVMARSAAKGCLILTLDLAGRTGHLKPADGTANDNLPFEIVATERIGASARTSSLSPVFESADTGHIGITTDGALTFNLLVHESLLERFDNPSVPQKGFMAKTWDGFVPGPEYWREIARVLKPGGIVFAFAGTRTADLLSIAMRLAGLERYDVLTYLSGSGFPKGHSISKAIDKAAGAEREVVGRGDGGMVRLNKRNAELGYRDSDYEAAHHNNITSPATPDAATWDGYNVAFKPAVEFILFFRKPRRTTYAATALEHGSGALNIDGGRIGTTDSLYGRGCDGHVSEAQEGWDRPWKHNPKTVAAHAAKRRANVQHAESLGRWPANLLLSHSPGCVRRGERRVKAHWSQPIRTRGQGSDIYRSGGYAASFSEVGQAIGYADADGFETVPDWECVPDCAVALLDATMVDNAGFSWYNKEPVEVNQCCENASIAVTSSLLELLTSSGALGDSVLEDALPIPCESEGSKMPGGNKTSAMGDGIVSGENQGAESSIGNSKADGYGSSPMGQSQMDTTSTTPTVIKRTTTCPTCNAFLHLSITLCTNGNEKITALGQTALKQDDANDVESIGRSPSLLSVQRGHTTATVSIVSLNTNENGARHTRTTPETTTGAKETQRGQHRSRFFKNFDPPLRWKYSSKASRAERDAGLEGMPLKGGHLASPEGGGGGWAKDSAKNPNYPRRNSHPCLKPLAVTRYLATLLRPPEAYLDDATLLVPFAGSGSEMIGALLAGWRNVVGIELEQEYVDIAEARLTWWAKAMALTHETEPQAILAAMKGRDIDDPVQAAMFNGALT